MKSTIAIASAFIISTGLSMPVLSMAASGGNQTGYTSNSTTTQGNSGKTSPTPGASTSNGTQTTTTTGPNGQIKQGNTTCNTCSQTTTGPGNSSK